MADADIFNIKNMYFQRKIADFVLFLTLRRSMVSRWKALDMDIMNFRQNLLIWIKFKIFEISNTSEFLDKKCDFALV